MNWWRQATMQEALAVGPTERAAATREMAAACAVEQARLNALTWTAPAEELAGSGRGPLAGFAAAIKANICGLGWPNDCASAILAGYRSPFDGDAVQRLRVAGCGFVGLTNMDEFGMGSSCEYTTYGPVHNPWNLGRTPGGSSGGSAALVAAGLAWFALGSDTGGSVRLPAHCCGVVGLKPTYGRVSRYGLIPFASSMDCVGVLARCVADAGLVFSVLAGPDPRDATCGGPAPEGRSAGPDPVGSGLGVPRDLLEGNLAADAAAEFDRVLQVCRRIGLAVEDIRLDLPSDPVRIYLVLAAAEAASNLARYDGSLYGKRPSDDPDPGAETPYAGMVTGVRSRGFGPEVRRRLLLGNHVLSAGARARFFTRAAEGRRVLTGRMLRALERNPVLILPTAAGGAFGLGERTADPLAMYGTDLFTVPASLAGLPALTLPTGLDSDGLPLSVQLVGRPGADEALLYTGMRLEAALDFRSRKEVPWRWTP